MCRPPSARRGKLNAFATPLRRASYIVLSSRRVVLSSAARVSRSNRVTVKLITASFPGPGLLHKTRDNHETVEEQTVPGEERNTFVYARRRIVDCNGKIRNKFREKFFRRVYPGVPLLLYLLLRDSLRLLCESLYIRFSPLLFSYPLCVFLRTGRVDKRFSANLEISKW